MVYINQYCNYKLSGNLFRAGVDDFEAETATFGGSDKDEGDTAAFESRGVGEISGKFVIVDWRKFGRVAYYLHEHF